MLPLGKERGRADAVTVLLALQHYPDERHGPERHARESRDGWGGYGSERRMNEGRGIPPPTRLVLSTRGKRCVGASFSRRVNLPRALVGARRESFVLVVPLSLSHLDARGI